ncbi:MAG: hypothetical protein ACREJM_03145, partial [Candidatus Saccharimonadales bacterium]
TYGKRRAGCNQMNWHALPTERNSELRMRSLLSAVQVASAFDRLDISFCLTTGLMLGGIAGGLIGHYVVPRRAWGIDDVARVFGGVAAGLVFGAIIGTSVWAFVRRRSAPFRQIRRVCRDYRVDPASLLKLAGESPRRVRAALRRIHEFWLLEARE